MNKTWKRLTRNKYFQAWVCFLYIGSLVATEPEIRPQGNGVDQAAVFWAVAVWLFWATVSSAIAMGIAYLTAPKPPKPNHAKPAGLEEFDVTTAEEGRPIQVLFGSRYITGPNIVWHGDFKSENVVERL